jgi:DNA-binding CsgD family transcriptional regulator
MVRVAHPAPTGTAERKRAMRERARRADAVEALRLAQSTVGYTITVLANGATAEAARQAAWEAAEELALLAQGLRRLTRLSPRERAAQAQHLAALGYSDPQIAARVGVSIHTVWGYRHGVRGDGQPWARREG